MYPRAFDYVVPDSIEHAAALLASTEGARLLAGGMSLIPMMKLRVVSPSVVVDLDRLEGLETIADRGTHICIGPLARHRDVASCQLIGSHAAALGEAAGWTGDVQVRNRGTLCGSLAHADPSGDQPAAVLALGGTLIATSARGKRSIPVAEFFIDAFSTALSVDEVLEEVCVDKAGVGEGSAYERLGRKGGRGGFPVAGAAAWVKIIGGLVVGARVALTGVSYRPVLSSAVQAALVGSDGSPETVSGAAARVSDDLTILEDLHGSRDYKAQLARVLTARALRKAIDRATAAYP